MRSRPMSSAEADGLEDSESEGDKLVMQIINEGGGVFSHDWDSGGPWAGAGAQKVYHWEGRFAVCSLDFGYTAGPFDSLDEALDEQNLLAVNSATVSVTCYEFSAAEL